MSYHWSIHQLTEYLISVSQPQDAAAAVTVALERASEAWDAEFGAVVIDGEVRGNVGFGRDGAPELFIAAGRDCATVQIAGLGMAHVLRADLNQSREQPRASEAWLIVGRLGDQYVAEEDQMLRGMALVLGLVLHNVQALQLERSRHQLVDTLLAIQRAISAHRPLNELLDAITAGASTLLGGCPIALLLTDPLTPGALMPASVHDCGELDPAAFATIAQLIFSDQDAAEGSSSEHHDMLVERVLIGSETAGWLVARPDQHGARRREQGEMLTAFAQQVSLALTDARALDALRQAHQDAITGLPNRRLFLERLEQERRHACSDGRDVTVLFIDLDNFKAVNDTLGHRAGDELLGEVARRLTACIRGDDIVARLGGDEFSILLDRGDVRAGRKLAERIIDTLSNAFVISDSEVQVGASVGIASLTPTHEDASALLSDADMAMYCAKHSGRGRWVVFAPHMHDKHGDASAAQRALN